MSQNAKGPEKRKPVGFYTTWEKSDGEPFSIKEVGSDQGREPDPNGGDFYTAWAEGGSEYPWGEPVGDPVLRNRNQNP